MLESNFQDNIDSVKNAIGQGLFDAFTGAIKTELENKGFSTAKQVEPIAKQEPEKSNARNYLPWLIGGVALIGGFLLLKRRGARV